MTKRPLILVTSDVRQLDGYTWHAAIDTYLRSVFETAQATPLILPAFGPGAFDQGQLDAVHGVLATGSRTNVHPQHYGIEATPAHEPFDDARDATSLPLLRAAIERGLPLLAICRGHQELNVAMGGTIDAEIQELDGRLDHRGGSIDEPVDHRFRLHQKVTLTPGGVLNNILGVESFQVNSVHRQAIGKLGDGLSIEAKAEDGTIEAVSVEGSKGFTLGVQWHPEHWASQSADSDEPSTKIFRAFGDAARAYQADSR